MSFQRICQQRLFLPVRCLINASQQQAGCKSTETERWIHNQNDPQTFSVFWNLFGNYHSVRRFHILKPRTENTQHTKRKCPYCFKLQRFTGSTSTSSRGDNITDEKSSQRPKSNSTIDVDEVSKFSALSALWWDEGGEFEALHSLNDLRIPLIRDALVSKKKLDQYDVSKPLEGFQILDVGSGGGLLSEPLARLGATVTGLEASDENIKIAQAHLIHDPQIKDKISYYQSTVEDFVLAHEAKFDAVVASEVLEHVADAPTFVSAACKLVKPGGSIFFTTLNKTQLAYAFGIVVAENILRLVPPGTHDWEKFVPPSDLQNMLEKNNFSVRLVHGMWYNPLGKRWSWGKDTSINYAIHAVRLSSGDEGDTK